MNLKNILLTILTFISTISFSQDLVDIKIIKQNNRSVIMDLYPQIPINNNVISSVVFSLRWKARDNVSFGSPLSNINGFIISKSGLPVEKNGFMYQVFAGFGSNLVTIGSNQKISITIPMQGRGKVEIINNQFIKDKFNGGYYVSIGGHDKTGSILVGDEISNSQVSNNISIFPNPSDGNITIKSTGLVGPVVIIQIFDIQGRSILKRNETISDGSLQTNVSLGSRAGVYILSILDGTQTLKSKFTIEN